MDSLITLKASQELAVQLSLKLLSNFKSTNDYVDYVIATELLSRFSLFASRKHIMVFQSHGVILEFVRLVFFYCERAGNDRSLLLLSFIYLLLNYLFILFIIIFLIIIIIIIIIIIFILFV